MGIKNTSILTTSRDHCYISRAAVSAILWALLSCSRMLCAMLSLFLRWANKDWLTDWLKSPIRKITDCRQAPAMPSFMKFGTRGQVTGAITYVKLLINQFNTYGVLTTPKLSLNPIDLLCQSSVRTAMRHCENRRSLWLLHHWSFWELLTLWNFILSLGIAPILHTSFRMFN